MQLITYVDRLAGDLNGLHRLLRQELNGLFSGVHLLPFFNAIDGADAGFDPTDHAQVDPRLGGWDDVAALSKTVPVMADLIVNHVSSNSAQFQDVLVHGKQSAHWNLFLKREDVFPAEQSDEQVRANEELIYRPRPTAPFTPFQLSNGDNVHFWTTFSSDQIDINVEGPAGQDYLYSILKTFSQAGVKEVRLDAAGYSIKRAGTRCFMLPETYEFLRQLDQQCRNLGMITLVEIHAHYQQQIEIARRVSRVYDFALPPLVLHALFQGDALPLVSWFEISPRNCVTVLDTHDGIGILDVAKDEDKPGLLNDEQIDSLVESIHTNSGGESRLASGQTASNLDIYQVNCTFFDALGAQPVDYLLARAIQFFAPGIPQVYYVGLLAGENDIDLLNKTDVGRDINRSYFDSESLTKGLAKPVVRSLIELIRLRAKIDAFDGAFSVSSNNSSCISMHWQANNATATLEVDFVSKLGRITVLQSDMSVEYQLGGDALFAEVAPVAV